MIRHTAYFVSQEAVNLYPGWLSRDLAKIGFVVQGIKGLELNVYPAPAPLEVVSISSLQHALQFNRRKR